MRESNDNKIADLLLRWGEEWEHGTDTPATQLCQDCPELATTLQERIDRLKRMAWMTNDISEEATSKTDPLLEQTLACRYQIESLIAQGGFGRVYKAFDTELERYVAIKVSTRMEAEGNQVEGVIEEARRVAKLRHPGIVAIHDVGTHENVSFIVSDLINGTNLAEVIADQRPTPRESVLLVAQIAENLQAAHEEGFVHRDIKPANILIDESGKPLLTDFGIATSTDGTTAETPATVGTLPYMSPEQVADEPQLIDARSDLYSLGVVLYELLTGRSPYSARTAGVLREQILFRLPAPIREHVPVAVEAVCMKAMSKHPADRFTSATEFAACLRESLSAPRISRRTVLGGTILTATAGVAFGIGTRFNQHSEVPASKEVNPRTFQFDGTNRIVTPLERFAPVTLEAWVRPDRFEYRCHFVIGSDLPGSYGIGIGICPTVLSAEWIPNDLSVKAMLKSEQAIPIKAWSHVAAVFGEDETRLYLNGELVQSGPATENSGGTPFVIGNVGETNHIDFFLGQIRSVRISRGERYRESFQPDEEFPPDPPEAAVRAVLIYDGASVDGEQVLDLSGNENHGALQTFEL